MICDVLRRCQFRVTTRPDQPHGKALRTKIQLPSTSRNQESIALRDINKKQQMSSKATATTKKREASLLDKAGGTTRATAASKKKKVRSSAAEREELRKATGYTPLTLSDIHDRIVDLCHRLPRLPEGGFVLDTPLPAANDATVKGSVKSLIPQPTVPCTVDKVALKAWAAATQGIIEEYSFIISNVSVATYKWGTDRSGAADQNLGLLGTELARSQEMVTSRIAPRLNDILCPVVTTLTGKTVTTKQEDGTEIKENYFVHSYEDVDYVQMCFNSLGRNAPHLRHLLLSNWDKVLNALDDYQLAQTKDTDSSRGLY